MTWPLADQSERWVDWSWYQNDGTLFHRPFDVDAFCAAHPYVEGAVIRAVWPDGTPDKHYPHYYDGFERNGKKLAAYLWPNPRKTIATMVDDWKRGLGDRVPKLLGYDYEEASTFVGKTNQELTSLMRASWEAAHQHFPAQSHVNYSRGSWLVSRIVAGDWIHVMKWWMAHYIYPDQVLPLLAAHWSEVDAMLPISNTFTPGRGPVRVENVVAWQFSSGGKIVPNGTSDMDYFLKTYVALVYGQPMPPPPPPPASDLPLFLRQRAGQLDGVATALRDKADELD
jgi:hypothetical protein